MKPTPGQDPARVGAVVHDLLRLLANTRSMTGTPDRPWQGQRDAYLAWADDTERRLRGLFDEEPDAALHTDRYWRIRELTEHSHRPAELVHAEIDAQHCRLAALIAAYPAPDARDDTEVGVRVVFDTNTHLHFPRFDQPEWAAELGAGPIVVVVPLLVLEELDSHKNRGAPVLGRRAGDVVRRILQAVENNDGTVDAQTRVQLLGDPDGHARRPNNDDEIMDRAADLARTPGPRVIVVTDDGSMRARAISRSLPVHAPRAGRLPATDPETVRLRNDVEAARKVLAARPDIKATFVDGAARIVAPRPSHPPRPRDEWITAMRGVAAGRWPPEDPPKPPDPWKIPAPGFGTVTAAAVDRFNLRREAWLDDIVRWAGWEYDRRAAVRAAVDLGLVVVNDGGAAGRDVELRVEVDSPGAHLADAVLRAVQERPEPPARPTPYDFRRSLADPARATSKALVVPEPKWSVSPDGRSAVTVLPLVRQGGRSHPVATLLLVPDSGPELAPAVGLVWYLNSAQPAAESRGRLVVLRTGTDEPAGR